MQETSIKEELIEIISKYNLGKYKSHKKFEHSLKNDIYLIRTTKGKYILKILKTENHGLINFQINLIKILKKNKIPVPTTIQTKNNTDSTKYKGLNVVIHEYIPGIHPKKINSSLTKDIAKKIGKMHLVLEGINLRGGDKWDKNHEFNMPKDAVIIFNKFKIKSNFGTLIADLKNTDHKKLKQTIINSDLDTVNLIVKNNKLSAFIDWDDSHKDFRIYDLATFIASAYVKRDKIEKEQINLFLKTYQKSIKLNDTEKMTLYYFIKRRLLGSINYCIRENKKKSPETLRWTENRIARFKTFNKLSLKEFMKLYRG